MKLVDEKGRLFGVINVFDLLVLCIIVSLAFFAIKWVRTAEDPSWTRVKTLQVRCIGISIIANYKVELVTEGSEMLNEDGLVVARIEKILNNEPANLVVYSSKDGEKLFFKDSKENRKLTILVDILSYERRGEIYSCMTDLPIKVGQDFIMNTKKYSINIDLRKILMGESSE